MMGPAADLCLLKRLGRDLNSCPDKSSLTAAINGTLTIQDLLIETLLKVRSKTRGLVLLSPNRAQQEYGRKCGRRNVVLKARQLGITTYVAARFFIKTITQPGTGTERSCWNPLPTARVACFMTNGKGRMRPATCGISFPGGTTRLTRSRMLKTCIH